MNKFLFPMMLMGSIGLLSACSSDSGSGKSNSSSNMVGTWTPKAFVTPAPEIEGHQDYYRSASGSNGYMFLEIQSDGTSTLINHGTHKPNGPQQMELRSDKIGRVENVGASESKFQIDLEYLKETAKSDGVSEEEIQKVVSLPCNMKMISADELTFQCGSGDDTSSYVRVSDEKRTQIQAETARALAYVSEQKPTLQKALAGKTFEHVETKGMIKLKSGEVIDQRKSKDQIQQAPDETGTGKDLVINAKSVSFSEDFTNALINGKRQNGVIVQSGHDFQFLHFETTYEGEDKVFHATIDGKIVLTENGFEIYHDVESSGGRIQKVQIYQIVR